MEQQSIEKQVFIVDGDAGARVSLRDLLEPAGYSVQDYGYAAPFLADHFSMGGCVIADVRVPDMSGLELQKEIVSRGLNLPVIITCDRCDVADAVAAMKSGASDFIEKPFDDETVLYSVARALRLGQQARGCLADVRTARDAMALLTPREHNVLDQLVLGCSNKVAAYELGISARTLEVHRAHIMGKMCARNLADLVRISMSAA